MIQDYLFKNMNGLNFFLEKTIYYAFLYLLRSNNRHGSGIVELNKTAANNWDDYWCGSNPNCVITRELEIYNK